MDLKQFLLYHVTCFQSRGVSIIYGYTDWGVLGIGGAHQETSITIFCFLFQSNCVYFDHCHPVIFDCLTDEVLRRVVLHMDGAAGPSGVDARGWRRLCTSFRSASVDLCHSWPWLPDGSVHPLWTLLLYNLCLTVILLLWIRTPVFDL